MPDNPRRLPMLDERKRSPFFVFRVESAYGRLGKDYSPKVFGCADGNQEGNVVVNIYYINRYILRKRRSESAKIKDV